MSAIFGFEEHNAQDFLEKRYVCLPHALDGASDLHRVVSPIKNEDIVFIKHSSPGGLQIKAVGVVQSDFPAENDVDFCMPVEWVWLGEKVLQSFDEEYLLRDNALYEEHDIQVQRAIIDLLPEKYQMPQEWQKANASILRLN